MVLPVVLVDSLLALIIGVVVWLVTWPVLRLLKEKLTSLSIFLILAMATLAGIIYHVFYRIVYEALNWAAPWHYNPFAPLGAFLATLLVLFFYYLLLFHFLLRVKLRNAMIASLVAVVTMIPAQALAWAVVSALVRLFP